MGFALLNNVNVDRLLHGSKAAHEEVCGQRIHDVYVIYLKGANNAGFMKVANAMLAQGCV